MNATSIEWTDFSSQLIRYKDQDGKDVWACAKVSPGCQHCYSEAIAHRYRRGGPFTLAEVRKVTPYFCGEEAEKLLRSKKLRGKRVFVGDMTDVFGEWVSDELLDRMFAVFALRPDVTFQVLTKRAERMRVYLSRLTDQERLRKWMNLTADGLEPTIGVTRNLTTIAAHSRGSVIRVKFLPPYENVWLGVSCEDQQRANERIPQLLMTPSEVRFVSAEPLLGPLDLEIPWEGERECPTVQVDWVIVGGESGHGARPCSVSWIRSIVGQCKAAAVPVFVKQLGTNIRDRNDVGFMGDPGDSWNLEPFSQIEHNPDGVLEEYQGAPVKIRLVSKKGGDQTEWPKDLRVREFPCVS